MKQQENCGKDYLKCGGKLLVETLIQIENETAPREKQGSDFSLAPMLSKEMSKIDWEKQTAQEIKNLVRGLNPIMGAYTFINEKKIKIWKVEILELPQELENLENGVVIYADTQNGLQLKAKDGIVKALEVQAENDKKMPVQDFLRGTRI